MTAPFEARIQVTAGEAYRMLQKPEHRRLDVCGAREGDYLVIVARGEIARVMEDAMLNQNPRLEPREGS